MKYRPKRLLVIAGPSGCGKSWFIDNIIKCNNPTADVMRLRKELEAGRIVIGNHIKISKLEAFYKSSNGLSSCLKKGGFVHFDFMSRRQDLRREILRDLVGAAERVIVLNLLASFDRWIEVQSARSLDLGGCYSPFASDLYVMYKKDPVMAERYFRLAEKKWIRYLAGLNVQKFCTHMPMSNEINASTISRHFAQDTFESIEAFIALRLLPRPIYKVNHYL